MTSTSTRELNKFERGIIAIHGKVIRPILWRKLYRTTHKLIRTQDISESDAQKQLQKFAYLYVPHGKKIKNMGKLILYNMMDAVIENQDDFVLWHFERTTPAQRYGFAYRTLKKMHRKISAELPHVRPYLTTIKFDQEYNTRPGKKNTYGYYNASQKLIAITPHGVNVESVYELIDTMAHEYIHLLQAAYSSSIPTPILRFIHTHSAATQNIEYHWRPKEKEARAGARMITRAFQRKFDEYCVNDYLAKKSAEKD